MVGDREGRAFSADDKYSMKKEYSPERALKLRVWERNRHHTDGADAVKANARLYVRQHSRIENEEYDAIMLGTEYFPMAARTLQSFVGLVFRRKPIFDEAQTFPPAITSDGRSAENLARHLMRDYMVTNDGGVLIDTPDTPAGATEADLAKLELYSYSTFYPAENIREIRHRAINGRRQLVYVRMMDDDDNGRELELVNGQYRATIWTNDDGAWSSRTVVPLVANEPLSFIPFVPLSDDDSGAAMDDLCATNSVHFNKSFLLAQAQAWVSSPVMALAGVKEDVELDFSPGAFWRFENPEAKWGFNEYRGDGVPIIERDMDRLEGHSSMLGSRMLIQEKAVSEAEGTVARRQAGENSILASMARHISAIMTRILQIQAQMMRKSNAAIRYTLSDDFVPGHADPALIGQLVSLSQAGKLPDEALFETLQRLDVISESWTHEQWAATIEMEKGARDLG